MARPGREPAPRREPDRAGASRPDASAPDAPLKIVHVTAFYPPDNRGGDGIHVQRLARALATRGHEVSVVCAPGASSWLAGCHGKGGVGADAGSDDPGQVTVHRLGGRSRLLEPLLVHQTGRPVLHRRQLRRLLAPVTERAPDVIHYHNLSLLGGVGVLGFGEAVKLCTPHEYWLVCPTHLLYRYGRELCRNRTCIRCTLRYGRPPQWWRYTGIRDRLLGEVDRFVYPSALARSVYRDQGVDRAGAVLWHFLPDALLDEARTRGTRPADAEPYFLYVGRLDAVKGVRTLVRHFASERVPAPLKLVGSGPLERELKETYGGSPAVEFLGSRDRDPLGELYRDALALILPSATYEVFGLVVAEAFAHGTPAIVTDVGGPRELVEASGAGFVYRSEIELGQDLERLASGRALRYDLGQRGLEFARTELREGSYVDRYEALVREIRGR